MDKEKFFKLFRENKKLKTDIAVVLALGIFLLVMSNQFFSGKKAEEPAPALVTEKKEADALDGIYDERELEKRLAEIFSQVEGAGEVRVMVVNSYSSEMVLAENVKSTTGQTTETATQGDKRTIENNNEETSVVVLDNGDGSSAPIILKEAAPKVEGIVIVAKGGDNIVVKDALSKAAQALLNVPAHKVEILKMK